MTTKEVDREPLDERMDLMECSREIAERVHHELLKKHFVTHAGPKQANSIKTLIAEEIDAELKSRLD